ncbi:uncharacterized protein LOC108887450 isoform X6 [Lates calcarifer]|uniref:Uncharacterized protein LOC108887450 isoform X6 n=1 Tax=Lates calcarifer TaxID=8187 RepID=A0AAJ7PTQ4_LATCA|nr:uncharacterized protein LOC108887450 isoform X6 [Lates calcarifer]
MALMDYMSLFLIVMVQSTAAATPITSYLSVRLGDEVTLSCGTVKSDWPKCDRTTWNFTDSRNNKATVTLFELGKIHEEAKSKSDRLSVTENCSLVIKKVTDEDAGLYGCRTKQQGQDKNSRSVVHLSVVTNWWWLSVILAVILVVLLITAAALIMWIQAKGDQSQMDHSAGLRLNPAGTQSAPETSQDMADPEDGVSYASVTYIKKANNQAQLQGNDDEDNTVTYSTVKLLSSSAGASTGLSRIHATINNPNI